jgi:hypothetical protein
MSLPSQGNGYRFFAVFLATFFLGAAFLAVFFLLLLELFAIAIVKSFLKNTQAPSLACN